MNWDLYSFVDGVRDVPSVTWNLFISSKRSFLLPPQPSTPLVTTYPIWSFRFRLLGQKSADGAVRTIFVFTKAWKCSKRFFIDFTVPRWKRMGDNRPQFQTVWFQGLKWAISGINGYRLRNKAMLLTSTFYASAQSLMFHHPCAGAII